MRRSVLHPVLVLACLYVLDATVVSAAAADPVPEGHEQWHLELGGWLVDWVESCPRSGGDCQAYFLVRDTIGSPDDAELKGKAETDELDLPPSRLLRLSPSASEAPAFETLTTGISPDIRLAALDVDQDGRPEPLLVRRGEASFVDDDGSVVAILREARAPIVGLTSSLDPHARVVAWASVGKVTFYRISKGRASRLSSQRLPVKARAGAVTLRLETPKIHLVEPMGAGASPVTFAVGPEQQGPSRWRVILFRPEQIRRHDDQAADGEESSPDDDDGIDEIWLRTPGPEKVENARFLQLADRPMLLAQALRSDKIGILERKKVRLYPLREDRTRSGVPPVFEHLSVSRLWQDLEVNFVDQNSDGSLELVLFQREGFGGKKLQVDVFAPLQSTPGATAEAESRLPAYRGLSGKSTRTMIKVPWSDWSDLQDLNGDGLSDMLLQSAGLHMIAGRAGRKGPFDSTPKWFLPLPDAADPGVSVSISVGPSEADDELDEAVEAAQGPDKVPTIRWGQPVLLTAARAKTKEARDRTTVLVLGREGSRHRGGRSHVFVLRLPG